MAFDGNSSSTPSKEKDEVMPIVLYDTSRWFIFVILKHSICFKILLPTLHVDFDIVGPEKDLTTSFKMIVQRRYCI